MKPAVSISKKFSVILSAILFFGLGIFLALQGFKKAPLQDDWQTPVAVPSIADFNGNQVTVRNVRNFRYNPTENDVQPAYYDKTYDVSQIKRVWYVTEPFNENKIAAHTFVSFEFNSGDFLAISIEARKNKSQSYSIWKALLRTYPLIYIAADERDVVLLRANVRKDKVFMYPVKLEKPENAGLLLTSMLKKMNELVTTNPAWYHTLFANCTSSIAKHINEITPERISAFSWQLWLTASADELAMQHGLLDTELTIEEARAQFSINDKSIKIGDSPNYSKEIRSTVLNPPGK